MPARAPIRTVGDVDSFIYLLRAACQNNDINSRLEALLTLPNERRKAFLFGLSNDLLIAGAPPPLLEALACLDDDAVAERAYEVIFRCGRKI